MQLKHLPRLGTVGLSSFDGIQSFWIRFWVSSLGIPRLSADKDAEMLLWDARRRKKRLMASITDSKTDFDCPASPKSE